MADEPIPDFRKILMDKNKREFENESWLVRKSRDGLGIEECDYSVYEFSVVKTSDLEKVRKERDFAEGLLGWAVGLIPDNEWLR